MERASLLPWLVNEIQNVAGDAVMSDRRDNEEQIATNPQLESQLEALTDLCWQALEHRQSITDDRAQHLLKALIMCGYERSEHSGLAAELESRIRARLRSKTLPHSDELGGMTKQLQIQYEKMAKWDSKTPSKYTPSQAANISSATDS